MLEAFGKGASDDIKAAKAAVYSAMTNKGHDKGAEKQKGQEGGKGKEKDAGKERGEEGWKEKSAAKQGGDCEGGEAKEAKERKDGKVEKVADKEDADCDGAEAKEARQEEEGKEGKEAKLAGDKDGSGDPSAATAAAAAAAAPPSIQNLPPNPLPLLHRLNELLKQLVLHLRQLCLNTPAEPLGQPPPQPPQPPPGQLPIAVDGGGGSPRSVRSGGSQQQRYNSLSQEAREWRLDPVRPCSGEQVSCGEGWGMRGDIRGARGPAAEV